MFVSDPLLLQSAIGEQHPLGISENVIRGILSDIKTTLANGNSTKAVHDLLMIQRLLVSNNNSSSSESSKFLVRETIGAILQNRPDIAKANLDIINNQLFPLSINDSEITNLEKSTSHPIQSTTTNNGSSMISKNLTSSDLERVVSNNTTFVDDNKTYEMSTPIFENRTEELTPSKPAIKFLNFTSPVFGIKIQYVENWSVRGYPYNKVGNNTVVGFYSPSKTATQLGNISGVSGQFVPYIDVFVFDSKGLSLDEIINGRLNRIHNITDTVIESKPYTLKGNRDAHLLIYSTITGGDEFFKKMQVYTVSNNKVYLITFTAQEALFSSYFPVVKNTIDSFEITPTGLSAAYVNGQMSLNS